MRAGPAMTAGARFVEGDAAHLAATGRGYLQGAHQRLREIPTVGANAWLSQRNAADMNAADRDYFKRTD